MAPPQCEVLYPQKHKQRKYYIGKHECAHKYNTHVELFSLTKTARKLRHELNTTQQEKEGESGYFVQHLLILCFW